MLLKLKCAVLRNLNKGCDVLNPFKNEIFKITASWMACGRGMATQEQAKVEIRAEERGGVEARPQKTIIQMLAPRSKAVTWTYEAFPRALEQGI